MSRLPHWPSALPVGQVRVARPTNNLDGLVRFYRDDLGLPEIDRFADHDGYSGVVLGLPGVAHHLELTQHAEGNPGATPTPDDLLVLYFEDAAAMAPVAARLLGRGHHPVEPANPYWTDSGAVTVIDPDGWRVVLMPRPFRAGIEEPVAVEAFTGERTALRPLFALADDSPSEVDAYLHAGRVLVARAGPDVVGHVQLVETGHPSEAEIKSLAVLEEYQGRGVGRRLVEEALALLASEGVATVRVATAAADTGVLRFYQRRGFRIRSVERDAFTTARGYPPGMEVDGIPVRDRVWLDIDLGPERGRD